MRILIFIALWLVISTAHLSAQKVSQALQDQMEHSGSEYLPCLVVMKEQAEASGISQQLYQENATASERAKSVIHELQTTANNSQKQILAFLANAQTEGLIKSYQSFWVVNLVRMEANPALILEVADREDVAFIEKDGFLKSEALNGIAAAQSVQDGLKIINAPLVWEMGFTGAGVLLMNIDTGVDSLHPALHGRWRGNSVPASQAWFDPVDSSSTPNDCHGHGTHTMGIMLGMDNFQQDTIGVAFDAEWMAARTVECATPHYSYTISAFQWALDPDSNISTTDDIPAVINNSWFDDDPDTDSCNIIFETIFTNMEAAGVALVFSAGNGGSDSLSITKPKNIAVNEVNTFAVGNLRGSNYLAGDPDPIHNTSSRGPSQCGGFGSLAIKPEVVAPGTSIRSSWKGGGYAYRSGTSMAAPHVSGAIALLKQAFPDTTGERLKYALYETAVDLGLPGEDNTYGRGLIDVYAAYHYLNGTLSTKEEKQAKLHMNCYPNPFSENAVIRIYLPHPSKIELALVDLHGRKITTIASKEQPPGYFDYHISKSALSSGVYLVQLSTEEHSITKKLVKH